MNETTDKHVLPYLSTVPTSDLVRELCSREGAIQMVIPVENTAYTRVWHNVTHRDTSYGIVIDQARFIEGPAKIIVVRGDE